MNGYRLRLLSVAWSLGERGDPRSGESWGDVVRRAWVTRHQGEPGQGQLKFESEPPRGVNTTTGVAIAEADELGGSSHINKVFHVKGDDGAEGVFKPVRGETIKDDDGDLVRQQIDPDYSDATLAEREVIASRVDQALGLGLAPETIMVKTKDAGVARTAAQQYYEDQIRVMAKSPEDADKALAIARAMIKGDRPRVGPAAEKDWSDLYKYAPGVDHNQVHDVANGGRTSIDDRAIGVGALSRFIYNHGPDEGRVYATPENRERAAKLGVFDAVIGNLDRHPENFLIGTDGKLYGIDHGYSFGVTRPLSQQADDSERHEPHFSDPEYIRSWALNNIQSGDLSHETQREMAKKLDEIDWKKVLRGSKLSFDEKSSLTARVQIVTALLRRGEAHLIKDHFWTSGELDRHGRSYESSPLWSDSYHPSRESE